MKLLRSFAIIGLAVLTLAACGDVREDLGLGRNAPDEFAVVDRPPLSMPPDFDLRPPQPGAPRPQSVDLKQRANDILFGGDKAAASDKADDKTADKTADKASDTPADKPPELSDAEKALLEKTGADKANPDIRQIVDHESAQKVSSSPHLVDELLWWKKDKLPGTTVDAAAEAQRIKEAKEKGEPLNQGATPVIEKQKSGWLGL
jgi:hypothetical protein